MNNEQPLDIIEESINKEVIIEQQESPVVQQLRRSTHERRSAIPDDYEVYLQESEFDSFIDDPPTYKKALESTESEKWIDAMKEEIDSMAQNEVWDLVLLPHGFKFIGCKWIYKVKRDQKGNIQRYKARLVAKGFTQKEGIDYT